MCRKNCLSKSTICLYRKNPHRRYGIDDLSIGDLLISTICPLSICLYRRYGHRRYGIDDMGSTIFLHRRFVYIDDMPIDDLSIDDTAIDDMGSTMGPSTICPMMNCLYRRYGHLRYGIDKLSIDKLSLIHFTSFSAAILSSFFHEIADKNNLSNVYNIDT